MLRQHTNFEDAWKTSARCNDGTGIGTSVFFSDKSFDILRAKAICSRCMVKVACRDAAKDRNEPCGVWGGELFEKGNTRPVLMRGRPPRNPRPEPVVEEVSLPPHFHITS